MKPRRTLPWLASIAPVALTLTMALSQSAQAQATWVGDTNQDWNTAANWSTDPNNPAGAFTINTATALVYPILGANSAFTPTDVIIGSGASQTGRFDHTGGALSQANVSAGGGQWFFVGRETGSATYNLADTAGTGGTLTGFAEGSGSLTVGKLWVGGSFNTVGTGTANINTSGTINANSTAGYSNHGGVSVIVGTGGGNGTMNIDKGIINAAGMVDVASAFSGAQATQGTLNIGAGGVLNCEGDFRTAFAGSAGALGTVVLSGGTLNVASNTERWIRLGNFDAGSSTITVNSGNLNLNKNTDIRFKTAGGSGSHTVNLNGGAITGYSDNKTTANGDSVVDLMNAGSTAINTFNLNGGTLTVRQVMTTNDGSTATFNFNGGTLKATGSTNNFVDLGGGSQKAFVKAGGAIIDSNGFDVRIPQPLLTDTVSTGGGLSKLGAGTLTLAGVSTYTGPTSVTAGRLHVTGAINNASALTLGAATLSGSGTVGPVTVNNAAAAISNGDSNTATLTLDSLAFTTTGTANLSLFDDLDPGIDVTNELNIGAGFTVNATAASPWVNDTTYDLITYGTLTGSVGSIAKGTISGLGARQNAEIGDSGSAITLTISGDTPVWTGAQSNAWTTAVIPGSKNWELQDAGTPTDFLNNDQVLFDDTATGTTDIDISTANVQVASVVFDNWGEDNFGLDYTISSSGGFGIADGSGPAALVKNGQGPVTLNTLNTYTGATTINDGTLELAVGNIASASAIVVNMNGTLEFDRSASFTNGNVISGAGDVVKNGAGTQILTADNTMSGVTTINAGTLQIGNGGTTGSLGTSAVVNDASLVFNRSSALTASNAISGTGSVSQTGTGALTLNGNSSYSGGTTFSSSTTILVGGNNALGTGVVTLAQGAVLGSAGNGALPNAITAPAATTATLTTNGANLTLNGNISGSGNLNRTATGNAASVFLGGNNSGFSGTFTIENNGNAATRFTSPNAGSANARWVNNNPTSGRVTIESGGGTYQFGSLTGSGVFSAQLAGINTIEVGNLGLNESYTGVLNQVGIGTLAVTKVGSGTWTLTGNNAYTGDTTVNGGVLATGGNSIPNTGKLVINGGKVQATGIEVVDTLFFGAVQKAAGTWGATGSGATNIDDVHFAGVTGVVSVTTAPPVAGYSAWAAANAPDQTMDEDHDNDGVENGIEYFMGLSGSAFTANPAPVSGTVTWTMGATYAGVYGTDYEVQTSPDLVTWTKVDEGTGDNTVTVTAGTSVVYDMPTGGKSFVRLVVKN